MEDIKTEETQLITIEPIVALMKSFVPEADEKTARAVKAMEAITTIETPEELEQLNGLLVRVKASYDKFYALRKAITDPLDDIKSEMMQYEKRVAYDGKTDNNYTRLRNLAVQYKQAELDRINKAANEAKIKKAREDYKVDLGTQIKQKLGNLFIDRVVETNDWSKKYFDYTTLENWEERVKVFMGMKPGLQEKFYTQCITVMYDVRMMEPEEFGAFIEEMKKAEPYEKWRDAVIEGLTPILSEWRAKIPAIKADKIALANASEIERDKIAEQQRINAQADEDRKKLEITQMQLRTNNDIAQQGEMNKMSNAFVEQASVQQMGDKGLITKVIKFTDPKLIPKALATIIFHVLAHPKFPGIQKKDTKKQLVVDAKGRPEYVEPVQKWLDFFAANCDAQVEGTRVDEDAKIIVKK